MKKLYWYQVENEDVVIKEEDKNIVMKHFEDEVELFYDNYRVYNEGGQYIADIIEIKHSRN